MYVMWPHEEVTNEPRRRLCATLRPNPLTAVASRGGMGERPSGSLARIGSPLGARKPGVQHLLPQGGPWWVCGLCLSFLPRRQGPGRGAGGGSTWFRTPGDTDTRAGSGHVLASPRRPLSRAFCRPGARTGRPHTQCLLEFPRCLRFRNFSFASTLLEYCLGEYEEVACHYGESFSEQLGDREQVSPCFKTPPLMSRHAARPPHLEQMLS